MLSMTSRRHCPWQATGVIAALAAALVVAEGSAVATPSVPAAADPSRVSRIEVNELVQSTGNLYWTSHTERAEFGGPGTASVYRASKSSTPVDEPRLLYRETRDELFYFSGLAYAKVGGVYYGYFVAHYPSQASGVSQIKRVRLAGGAATVIATLPRPAGGSDLRTDGKHLFWADSRGLRRMPVAGGSIRTLVRGKLRSYVQLDAKRVFYSTGRALRSVPKVDGTVRTHAVGSAQITAMHVRRTSNGSLLTWGERTGIVASRLLGGSRGTHQQAIGRRVTSVFVDGPRVLWTDCTIGAQSNACTTRKRKGVKTTVVGGGEVSARNVQGDATAMYWSDIGGIVRFVH